MNYRLRPQFLNHLGQTFIIAHYKIYLIGVTVVNLYMVHKKDAVIVTYPHLVSPLGNVRGIIKTTLISDCGNPVKIVFKNYFGVRNPLSGLQVNDLPHQITHRNCDATKGSGQQKKKDNP